MRTPRLFVDMVLAPGAAADLPPDTAHYVGRVLRLHEGAQVALFNASGDEFDATIAAISARSLRVQVGNRRDTLPASPLQVTLLQGLCRGQRMDYSIQKATELGVARIVPLQMDRSVVRLSREKADKRVAHWRSIAISACEQCGRADIPRIDVPTRLAATLTDSQTGVLAMLDGGGDPPQRWGDVDDSLTLIVGPEGGFSDAERQHLCDAGVRRWRMGPRTLRTETAGMIALALAQSKWGDMR